MSRNHQNQEGGSRGSFRGILLLLLGCIVIVLLGVFRPKLDEAPPVRRADGSSVKLNEAWSGDGHLSALEKLRHQHKPPESAGEIVARRLKLFSRKQHDLVRRMAEYYKLQVPPEVDRFFAALDAGDWPGARQIFLSLRDGDNNSAPKDPELKKYWRAMQEAYGAAQQAQLWPPQQFLDYGNGILNSLSPGMVYLGGTDAGCFICTMLNATSDGEQHITLTQNALADPSYLDYLRFSSGGNLNLPTAADQQAAVAQYQQDAQSRLAHDQQYPDEPKQVLPGENISMTDGKVTVEGLNAVMAVNNLLVQNLLRSNPGLSFAMEDSFPMASTYAGAAPLGSIFALNANANGDNSSALTADAANQAVNHWQDLAQTLSAAPDASSSVATMVSYAHDAAAQGNLLANNNYPAQAEQAFQTALEISPNCIDAALGLAKVLAAQGQLTEANQTLDAFAQNNPQQRGAIANFRSSYFGNK